ncbi:MAG: ATP synthase F1 subunit gamma [Tannerellaceae bacterium]|jgi:F-type H+-transporting ATPase subunit gamma|nr:ATP synthase F1 subunit gamma [Tannerellaceae bacterium]
MASLKEIKGRIASVRSTQKITEAMKLVASAKLRKIQYQTERFLPYENRLGGILHPLFCAASEGFHSPFAEVREAKRIALVVFSSNTGLCGAFNSNILRLLWEVVDKCRTSIEEILVFPIGKKAEDAVRKSPIPLAMQGSYTSLIDKPDFEGAKEIANRLTADFLAGKIDRIELIYNHFKSMAVQLPVKESFLPFALPDRPRGSHSPTDYLIEPDRETLLNALIPNLLRSKLYAILLDSTAAEQAARTVAMQIATDNVDEILEDLTLRYNKQRQQAISNEILDIIGGSEALNR